jgi:hypothetical protein
MLENPLIRPESGSFPRTVSGMTDDSSVSIVTRLPAGFFYLRLIRITPTLKTDKLFYSDLIC